MTKVEEFLKEKNNTSHIYYFDVSSATVDLAAEALQIDGDRIAKTLAFVMKDDSTILVVASGYARVDNKKFKAQFGCKAKMTAHDETPERCGHPVGGVCPFAVKEGVKIYLDKSLKKYDIVYPAAGTANSAIEITLNELERVTDGVWVDVCQE